MKYSIRHYEVCSNIGIMILNLRHEKRLWVVSGMRQLPCLIIGFPSPSHQECHIVCSAENTVALRRSQSCQWSTFFSSSLLETSSFLGGLYLRPNRTGRRVRSDSSGRFSASFVNFCASAHCGFEWNLKRLNKLKIDVRKERGDLFLGSSFNDNYRCLLRCWYLNTR